MDAKYDPQAVESAAQAHWQRSQAYRAVENSIRPTPEKTAKLVKKVLYLE